MQPHCFAWEQPALGGSVAPARGDRDAAARGARWAGVVVGPPGPSLDVASRAIGWGRRRTAAVLVVVGRAEIAVGGDSRRSPTRCSARPLCWLQMSSLVGAGRSEIYFFAVNLPAWRQCSLTNDMSRSSLFPLKFPFSAFIVTPSGRIPRGRLMGSTPPGRAWFTEPTRSAPQGGRAPLSKR